MLTGGKGCGKDTVATIIKKYLGTNSKKFALAYPMKEVAKELFMWDDSHTDGALKERKDDSWSISPRRFLQEFGTFMREILPEREPSFSVHGSDFLV